MELSTLGTIGGVIFALYFTMMGMMHWAKASAMTAYAQSNNVPAPGFAVFFTGLMMFVGGLFILLGVLDTTFVSHQLKIGAWLIIIFLFFTSFMMHPFWKSSDPQQNQMHMAHFMKNWALLGAALMLL